MNIPHPSRCNGKQETTERTSHENLRSADTLTGYAVHAADAHAPTLDPSTLRAHKYEEAVIQYDQSDKEAREMVPSIKNDHPGRKR